MAIGEHEGETRLAAAELAKALRSGLELRWPLPAPLIEETSTAFPRHGDIRSFLERYADNLRFSPPRRRQLSRRLLRLIRVVLRKLFAPWLRQQTLFNRSAISTIEHLERRIRHLEEAEKSLRQTIGTLEKSNLSRRDNEIES